MDPVIAPIASVIGIIGGIAGTWNTISKISGLPEAFRQVEQHLPLVEKILENIVDELQTSTLDPQHVKAIQNIVSSCNEKAKRLDGIFEEIKQKCEKEGTTDWTTLRKAYKKTLHGIKARRVEALMKDILQGLQKLALDRTFQPKIGGELDSISEAIKELSDVEPSLEDSEFGRQGPLGIQNIESGATGYQTNAVGDVVNHGIYAVNGNGNTFQIGPTPNKDKEEHEMHKWLQMLYKACPYREAKDRNPPRVERTCKWFTSHSLFQTWCQGNGTSRLLWVSANPGCGKSVLAKYLVDDVVPRITTSPVYYFFFKEDFPNQRSSKIALCSLLYQSFDSCPESFSPLILKNFQKKGEALLTSFGDLWDIFITAMESYETQPILILDALDECEEQERDELIEAICKYSQRRAPGTSGLRFLLTSRPYANIERRFHKHLPDSLPRIHLAGESEEEQSMISSEIEMVIRSKAIDLSQRLKLNHDEEVILINELTQVPNHTYLWVHLTFSELEDSILLTPGNIRLQVRAIPRTVSEAYERILSKSRDTRLTKKLLHIIIAAARPLTLKEMSMALAIANREDLVRENDLVPEERFCNDVRQLCGLFVIIVDSKVYLLHQTAREFLLSPPSSSLNLHDGMEEKWECSFDLRESHHILARICIQRLPQSETGLNGLQDRQGFLAYVGQHIFLDYAVRFWAHHFRLARWSSRDDVVEKAVSCCRLDSPTSAWFKIYQVLDQTLPGGFTSLILASALGLSEVVERLLMASANTKAKEKAERSRLWLASSKVHPFSRGVVTFMGGSGRRLSPLLEAKDSDGQTPLHHASMNGYDEIVEQLLKAGADVNTKKPIYGWTPLHHASESGHDTVVQQLLNAGADINAKERNGRTPLHCASANGHDMIVQQLLKAGADVDARDSDDWTPLHHASVNGYYEIVERLFKAGADVNAKDSYGRTPRF